jgi:hypothetical protein
MGEPTLMDIFEQLECAHIILVNNIPTINFGWNADDEEEDWCLSIYGRDDAQDWEYYFSYEDMVNAKPYGDAFLLRNDTVIEFCKLVNAVNC